MQGVHLEDFAQGWLDGGSSDKRQGLMDGGSPAQRGPLLPPSRPPAWQRASALLARPSNAPPLPESQTTVVLSIAQLLRARPALYNQLLPALYSRG